MRGREAVARSGYRTAKDAINPQSFCGFMLAAEQLSNRSVAHGDASDRNSANVTPNARPA
jgi:hypothetical protein